MQVTHSHIQRLFKIKNELQEVYWNLVLETFAKSLIGIFLPIYLLTLGFLLPEVFLFALFYFGSLALLSTFSAKLTTRFGYKHQILYRIPVFILFYSMLILMQFISFPLPLLLLAGVIGGFQSALYWIPLNAEFVKNTKKIREGVEIAEAVSFTRFASIAAPTVAALVIFSMGFNPLFAIVIFIMIISGIPLFATKDSRGKFSFREEKSLFIKSKVHVIHQFLQGILLITETFMWPIFIFLTLGNFLDVGYSISLTALGIAIFTLLIGKMTDRGHSGQLLKVGGLAYAIIWIARIFASTPLEMLMLSFLGGMFFTAIQIPVFAAFCDIARGKRVIAWVVVREQWLGLGRIASVLLVLFAIGFAFPVGFIFAAAASLLFLFL